MGLKSSLVAIALVFEKRAMPSRTDIEETLYRIIGEVLQNKGEPVPELSPTTSSDSQLGLESLDWAEVVVRMEMELGYDPFQSDSGADIRTLGDLVTSYERAV